MNSSAVERDLLRLACIPLVHLGDIVDTATLLARKVCRCQRRSVERGPAKGRGVVHDNVCGSTGGERRDGDDFGEHVEV